MPQNCNCANLIQVASTNLKKNIENFTCHSAVTFKNDIALLIFLPGKNVKLWQEKWQELYIGLMRKSEKTPSFSHYVSDWGITMDAEFFKYVRKVDHETTM